MFPADAVAHRHEELILHGGDTHLPRKLFAGFHVVIRRWDDNNFRSLEFANPKALREMAVPANHYSDLTDSRFKYLEADIGWIIVALLEELRSLSSMNHFRYADQ